jgi:hypothetical protein
MRFRLRGRYWKIVRGKLDSQLDGLCDASNRTITVRPSLCGERELEVMIHEMLHACHWDLGDEAITETSEDLARVLFRLGYRKSE